MVYISTKVRGVQYSHVEETEQALGCRACALLNNLPKTMPLARLECIFGVTTKPMPGNFMNVLRSGIDSPRLSAYTYMAHEY